MKFLSLRIHNWRSFYGDHQIEMSTDPDKPVTLLLGPNGSGKTALLNAFTWALYGSFTEGFKLTDSLVNFEAVALDSAAEAWVEVTLTHEDDDYTVRRSTDAQRQLRQEYELTVTKNGDRAVEDDIHRILPEPLKDLFFFPAETFSRASVLDGDTAGEGTSFDVGKAIRSLLSGDIYDHASADLRRAIESETLKPPKNYRDETVEKSRREYEQSQEELNAAEERYDILPGLLASARDQAAKAKQEAERYDPKKMQRWQQEHDDLRSQVQKTEQAVARADDLYLDLARTSHLYFSRLAVNTAVDRLNAAEEVGLMPPRIDESVLEKTLTTGRCMLCLEEISDDSRKRVTLLRERAADAQVAVRGLETRSLLNQYLDRHRTETDRLREEALGLANDLGVVAPQQDADVKMLRAVVRSCIDVADALLKKTNREFEEFQASNDVDLPADGRSPVEVAMVKQRLVDTLETEFREIDVKVNTLKKKTKDAFADYQTKSGKSDDHRLKTTAIEILTDAKAYFDVARKGLEEFGRADFQNAINLTYADLIAKPLEIRVGDDFSIRVFQTDSDVEMPLSQSESVLLLISFLGAIARLAPHYEQIALQSQQFRLTGGVSTSQKSGFPVVLDAPTSPFDGEYEEDVVAALPNLLPQVIVPVSAKSVEVWERIESSIGRAYVMELTSTKTTNRTVRWKGKDHTYSVEDEAVDPARTRIVSLS